MQIFVLVLLGLAPPSSCEKSGLRGVQLDFGEAVLRELEDALGSSDHREQTEQELRTYEDELRVTFNALPKNKEGTLEGPYVRYALHRLFVQRYGWQVKGLEASSGAWYAGASHAMMGERVPPKMRELFERRLGSYGLKLHELAVVAATLDSMFRKDVYDRLRVVYRTHRHNESDVLNFDQAAQVGMAYMSTLILGNTVETLREDDVLLSTHAFEYQDRYRQIKSLLFETNVEANGPDRDQFQWEDMATWMTVFGKKLGHLEDKECRLMKHDLIRQEWNSGTGRVTFDDFATASTNFEESLSDLRAMEALDETNPENPQVIIPNYLQGTTNCINPAGYYSICCFDECEELMDKIEARFQAPAASPSAIASFVASLQSDTEPANRTLSPELLEMLEVQVTSNGMVPLHSKNFAEFMHRAYPRECSHPQQSNSDRFDQTLRHVIDRMKGEAAEELKMINPNFTYMSKGVQQSATATQRHEGSIITLEVVLTCILGFVGMGLAKMLCKRRNGKSVKLL